MTETIARLHIALADTDPLIWRRVYVPVEANLKMLHDVIQGAMGWLDYYLWEFEADDSVMDCRTAIGTTIGCSRQRTSSSRPS